MSSNIWKYGQMPPSGILAGEKFENHPADRSWSDGGIAVELAAAELRTVEDQLTAALDRFKGSLGREISTYGAYQARDAVFEYFTSAPASLLLIEGRLKVSIEAANDAASMSVYWDLQDLINAAGEQAANARDATMANALNHLVGRRPATPEEIEEPAVKRQPERPKGRISSAKSNANLMV